MSVSFLIVLHSEVMWYFLALKSYGSSNELTSNFSQTSDSLKFQSSVVIYIYILGVYISPWSSCWRRATMSTACYFPSDPSFYTRLCMTSQDKFFCIYGLWKLERRDYTFLGAFCGCGYLAFTRSRPRPRPHKVRVGWTVSILTFCSSGEASLQAMGALGWLR